MKIFKKSDKRLILGALLQWRRSYFGINKIAAHANNINAYIYMYVCMHIYIYYVCVKVIKDYF